MTCPKYNPGKAAMILKQDIMPFANPMLKKPPLYPDYGKSPQVICQTKF
jgi:hypothetical protein